MKKHPVRKILIIIAISLFAFVAVVIIFISPITKYMVEKHSVEYTGRRVKMDWAYVNPFTGFVHFSNFKVYEANGDSIFFSAGGISISFAMMKMLSKTYQIDELTLTRPHGIVIQQNKRFNFDDLIAKFTPKKTNKPAGPVHFNILNVKIIDGTFYYSQPRVPIYYYIKNVNLESSGKRWDADTTDGNFSFMPGLGSGNVKGSFFLNFKNLDYRMNTAVRKFDLNILQQYLRELSNYGTFSAFADADLKVKGNFNDGKDVDMKGEWAFNDFHFGKQPGDDYASFKNLKVKMYEINPKGKKYLFDSVVLTRPFIKYEKYDSLDNYTRIFGINGSNISNVNADPTRFNLILEIAKYIQLVSEDFLKSDYKINRLAINEANIEFNDYSLNEKFSTALNPLTITADTVDKAHKRAYVNLKGGFKPYGDISASVSLDPKNVGNFDLTYKLEKLPSAMFNPYLVTYTSFPLDRGTLELYGKWSVNNKSINSDNHLLVMDPRVAKRIKKKDTKWEPVPLIMAFVRDRGNVIDYDIPITGNTDNPNFHLHDVLMKILQNMIVKPATTPYRFEVKDVEQTIEKSQKLQWQMRQIELTKRQEKFVGNIIKFLQNNPGANISVYPIEYALKEKENILFYEAKKKYYMLANSIKANEYTGKDSEYVDKMSSKNAAFVKFINRRIRDTMMFTLQQKCNAFLGESFVNARFARLVKDREKAFLAVMKEKGVGGQVKMHPGENTIPYNGFSYYKISYNGDIPPKLAKAYQELDEFNEEAPRDEYMKERGKF